MRPIILSLLDTDFYKITMMQAVLHNFPNAWVRYEFACRGPEGQVLGKLKNQIEEQIDHYCSLTFTDEELSGLAGIRFIKKDFVGFLRGFMLSRKFVKAWTGPEGDLRITIEGPWHATIIFETAVLAIVNELYNRTLVNDDEHVMMYGSPVSRERHEVFVQKWSDSQLNFGDFGTRRRWSRTWHEKIVKRVAEDKYRLRLRFFGTSNVWLAFKYNLRPFGTMAHEWLMAGQAMGVPLRTSQRFMLEKWIDEYDGDLGIALTDVIGIDAFVKDCSLKLMKLYDGFRHDSGPPIQWFKAIRQHVLDMRQDPLRKSFIFSNGLTIDDAVRIHMATHGLGNTMFAIGTKFTNDTEYEPLRIVIKMVECNRMPLAKITDEPGKETYEDETHYKNLCEAYGVTR